MMSAIGSALIGMIKWYQRAISAKTPPCCKYYPSCSHYAITAVRRFGAVRGIVLFIWRFLRCNPWSRGGIDDVPQHFSLCYRFRWSKAYERPRLTPMADD
ncbi:membrane protein insertion efficiency factor YidD [Bifidobacterium sp. TKU]|nr:MULTISPECIES: membrane protein insertion efficiency factor YidD [Bifidobacterium]MBH8616595.1 membrane protein insertion efficiency factor YidD [Bifidobacterium bifidum]MBH8618744.1 membrane protein insertion efficiency factor YidD [Bifidobacterium bifidum]MCC3151159.1 membrane protein insertion efficiency factor YidD [Bifidobacterium bifidum]MCC8307003.1 membrane protein insertion efficiency factor YidD [Bifidobacterium bifidum]MCC9293088.1 membrane protein insertion efficiency factor YidD